MVVSGTDQASGQYSAVRGMERSSAKMADAAEHIAQATAAASGPDDRMAASIASEPAVVIDLERSMIDLSMGDQSYRANLRSARASDAQFQQLIDMAIPQGYSQLVDDTVV